MGPWLFIEASIAALFLTAMLARADSPFGQPSNTQVKPPPVTTPTNNPTGAPTAQPTSNSRSPGSLDSANTYHSTGAGFILQGSPQSKEPVIDGKSIPKTIDFSSTGSSDTKPTPRAGPGTPPKKRGAPKKGKGRRVHVEKSIDSPEEDDGL